MRVHPAVLAALVWPLASACSTSKDYSDRQPPPRPPEAPLLGSPDSIVDGISIARVSVADSSDVPMRALRTAGSILLEANPGVVSPDIRDVAASGDTVFVLDGSGPAIEAFRRSGRRLWRADNASAGLELDEPQRLTLYHDSLYVADVGNGGHVAILTVDGRLARQVHIDTDRGIWSLAVTRNRLFASLVDPEDGDSSMSLVLAADRTGRILGRGCRRHPLMVVSIARGDLLNVARLTNVWTDGSSAFCQQMISPVVQILDSAGRLTGVENVAPPFYRKPVDEPGTTNDRLILANSAKWFPLLRFFPTSDGFTAVYAAYDTATEVSSYRMFACRHGRSKYACYTATTGDRPLAKLPADTLVALRVAHQANEPAALDLLVPNRAP